MSNREIDPELYISVIVEKYLKNMPALLEVLSLEEIYETLRNNIAKVCECDEEYTTYGGLYIPATKCIVICNSKDYFDERTIIEKSSVAVHETIHALFNGFRRGDNTLAKNIKGFCKREGKYKYQGALLSQIGNFMDSFSYWSKTKGFSLDEGFTEWLSGKACGYSMVYEEQVAVIRQFEAIFGEKGVIDIAQRGFYSDSSRYGMNENDFEEFIYRNDEALRARYREDVLDMIATKVNDRKDSEKTDSEKTDSEKKVNNENELTFKEVLILTKFDILASGDEVELDMEKYGRAKSYFERIKTENLIKTERILLDNVLCREVDKIINKDELLDNDIMKLVEIYNSVNNFIFQCKLIISDFKSNESYLRFASKVKCGAIKYINKNKNSFINVKELTEQELKIKLDVYTLYEDINCIDDIIDFEPGNIKEEYFNRCIYDEFREKIRTRKKIDYSELDYVLEIASRYNVSAGKIWNDIFGRKLSAEEITKLEEELYDKSIGFQAESIENSEDTPTEPTIKLSDSSISFCDYNVDPYFDAEKSNEEQSNSDYEEGYEINEEANKTNEEANENNEEANENNGEGTQDTTEKKTTIDKSISIKELVKSILLKSLMKPSSKSKKDLKKNKDDTNER